MSKVKSSFRSLPGKIERMEWQVKMAMCQIAKPTFPDLQRCGIEAGYSSGAVEPANVRKGLFFGRLAQDFGIEVPPPKRVKKTVDSRVG